MKNPFILHPSSFILMDLLWLGYDGLSVRFVDVTAVLLYHPSLDARIVSAYGRVPANVAGQAGAKSGPDRQGTAAPCRYDVVSRIYRTVP